MANLTPGQKWHVCDLAKKAYEAWPGRENYERMVSTGLNAFTAWRHDQQETAVGVRSLRHCSDADYKPLVEHFHRARKVFLQDAAIDQLSFSP
jgi:hypothetical protein